MTVLSNTTIRRIWHIVKYNVLLNAKDGRNYVERHFGWKENWSNFEDMTLGQNESKLTKTSHYACLPTLRVSICRKAGLVGNYNYKKNTAEYIKICGRPKSNIFYQCDWARWKKKNYFKLMAQDTVQGLQISLSMHFLQTYKAQLAHMMNNPPR